MSSSSSACYLCPSTRIELSYRLQALAVFFIVAVYEFLFFSIIFVLSFFFFFERAPPLHLEMKSKKWVVRREEEISVRKLWKRRPCKELLDNIAPLSSIRGSVRGNVHHERWGMVAGHTCRDALCGRRHAASSRCS